MSSPSILVWEVGAVILKTRLNKALAPDTIPVEILKILDEEGKNKLSPLFNQVYQTWQIPREWLESTFIPLLKKNKTFKCADFWVVSLMSDTLNILLKTILGRIYARCESILSETQFGFRGWLGTRHCSVWTFYFKGAKNSKSLYMFASGSAILKIDGETIQ